MDIVFLTLPRLELRSPITAPAILKSTVESKGYTAFCFDTNLELWHALDSSKYGHIWFDTDLTFRYEDKFIEFWKQVVLHEALKWIEVIRDKAPRWVGITIFSQRSRWISISMCKLIREKLPEIKIVVGGPFSENVGPHLYKNNLVDAYVVGEGEQAILDILDNNLNGPGINGNSPVQIDDLDTIPIPDYSDFKMHMYPKTWNDPRIKENNKLGTEFIYITGSRGCVRKCSFCDIGSIWPKFRYRSGKSIAEEMRIQNTRYGSKRFLFTDSLINGSLKQLKDLCNTLIMYYEQGLMSKVKWQGQFIARSANQMPEDMYKLLSDAGCFFVSIGVESGSEKVRSDMKKMFNDDALNFTISMCEKYGIEMAWLLLVGYPTETEEEFQKTLNMLTRYSYLNNSNLVRSIALGPTLDIVPGSPLYANQKDLNITWDNTNNWVYKDNTREVRIRRWLRLKEHCINLKYPIVEKATEHLLNELKKLTDKPQEEMKIYDHFNENLGSMGPSI